MSEEKLSFQWIKGERLGTVEVVSQGATDDSWINFESGRRINKDLINEFMMQVDSINIIPFENKPDKPTVKKAQTSSPKQVAVTPPTDNIIKDIINSVKEKSLQKEKINIQIEIQLPKKAVFSVLEESFGDDIFNAIHENIKNKINSSALEEYFEKALRDKLKTFYKNDEGNNHSSK